jgi:SAM-dependent methyltransferase
MWSRIARAVVGTPPDDVYVKILTYYTEKVLKHGATPRGVDWAGAAAQELRFALLLKVCDFSSSFSLNDMGCGYGALLAYLAKSQPAAKVDYLGIDLSPAMIRAAERLWRSRDEAKFIVGNVCPRSVHYSVASGIFNVKLDVGRRCWEQFIAYTLANLRTASRRGFAVNFKANNDACRPSSRLYFTTPQPWIRFCEQKLGSSVELLTDYGLGEFTLLVRPS